jgi:hypothetical protein
MGIKKQPAGLRAVRSARESTEDDQPMPGWKRVPKIAREAIATILDTIDRRQRIKRMWTYEKDKGK